MVSIKLLQVDKNQITQLARYLVYVNYSVPLKEQKVSLKHFSHALTKLKVEDQHSFVNFYW